MNATRLILVASNSSSPTTSTSNSGNSNLEWLVVLVPVVGALLLYTCVRLRNARRRASKRAQSNEEHGELPSMAVATESSVEFPFTMHTSEQNPELSRISAGQFVRNTSILATGGLQLPANTSARFERRPLLTVTTEAGIDHQRLHHGTHQRGRRRVSFLRTPPPIYPGSPPPKYEEIVSDDESLADVQSRLVREAQHEGGHRGSLIQTSSLNPLSSHTTQQ